jgi:hypothetical protein
MRLTMRPRFTAGRAWMASAQRCTFSYSSTDRNSAAPYSQPLANPPYQGKIAMLGFACNAGGSGQHPVDAGARTVGNQRLVIVARRCRYLAGALGTAWTTSPARLELPITLRSPQRMRAWVAGPAL